MKIQQVIDRIMESVPVPPIENTVDVFKSGDPEDEVTGIVTTFTATMEVLQKTTELGANLIITHEPTFYDHWERTEWLGDNPIFQAKSEFIRKHGLTIWRFHDYWHRHNPDGIDLGMLRELNWEKLWDADSEVVTLPGMKLADLVLHLKKRLRIPHIRIVGDKAMVCRRVGVGFGAPGGVRQIHNLGGDVDTLLCGETVEWQTCEYVRDSNLLGVPKALVIMGHVDSEELGMKYLAEWLQPKVGEVPVTFVPAGSPILTI